MPWWLIWAGCCFENWTDKIFIERGVRVGFRFRFRIRRWSWGKKITFLECISNYKASVSSHRNALCFIYFFFPMTRTDWPVYLSRCRNGEFLKFAFSCAFVKISECASGVWRVLSCMFYVPLQSQRKANYDTRQECRITKEEGTSFDRLLSWLAHSRKK